MATATRWVSSTTHEYMSQAEFDANDDRNVVIATKFTTNFKAGPNAPPIMANFTGNGRKSLHTSVNASLKKLQTDYIDLLYVHWWDYSTSIPELMQALNHLVVSGKVLYLGISDTPAWVVSKANEYARNQGLTQFSVYQGRWSAASRDFEREIIPMCRNEGMGLAPWGALGGGKFKTEEQRKASDGRQVQASEVDIKASQALEKIAKSKNTLITSIALAYVMHKTPYVFPIVGGRKVEHLKGNIEALTVELSDEDIKEIDDAVPFDIGFPHNFLWGASMPESFQTVNLLKMAANYDYVNDNKVCFATRTSKHVMLTFSTSPSSRKRLESRALHSGRTAGAGSRIRFKCHLMDTRAPFMAGPGPERATS